MMRSRSVFERESPLPIELQEAKTLEAVSDAAWYFPLETGKYEVKPGLMPLGTDLGNGEADKRVFQIDQQFAHYRQVKRLARAERLEKYYQIWNYSDAVAGAIAHLLLTRLPLEYPQYFRQTTTDDRLTLHNHLTTETLHFNPAGQLQEVITGNTTIDPPYVSALDALAMQVQEDLAVVCREGDQNWLAAVHLCHPNHWAAEDKIGRDFAVVHDPVAGMEKINRRSGAIVHTMITRPPMVRFGWGISTDTRLNHHPQSPPGIPSAMWQGRQFDIQAPRLYLRLERQVLWGLPEVDACLFTIRTYFRDCHQIKQQSHDRDRLLSALQSMSSESLAYKGLTNNQKAILSWLGLS
jgi:dimethylamine monooxygenase subunit A